MGLKRRCCSGRARRPPTPPAPASLSTHPTHPKPTAHTSSMSPWAAALATAGVVTKMRKLNRMEKNVKRMDDSPTDASSTVPSRPTRHVSTRVKIGSSSRVKRAGTARPTMVASCGDEARARPARARAHGERGDAPWSARWGAPPAGGSSTTLLTTPSVREGWEAGTAGSGDAPLAAGGAMPGAPSAAASPQTPGSSSTASLA